MKYSGSLIAMAALAATATLALAQQPPAPFATKQLAPDVYVVTGGGGNSGVIVGRTGVIVIDAKTTEDGGKELLADIAKITPKPVTTVILTHSDNDHVGGLAAFPAGLKIYAHQGNTIEMNDAAKAGGRGAPSATHLPNVVVWKKEEPTTIDGVRLTMLHWAPAHTSGDLVVYLPNQKIVFTGDIIVAIRPDPIIHLEKNGSTEGLIETMKGILAQDATTFVPGHGDPETKDEVQKRLAGLVQKRDEIKKLISEGKTLPEIKKAVGDPEPSATPGRGPAFGTLADTVYAESQKKS